MVELSSDRFFRVLFHKHSRPVLAAAVGMWVLWLLTGRGWPWWAWLPAVILTTQAVYAVLLVGVYAYHKATYQRRAEMMRQQLREADNQTDNEDQAHPSSLTN
jgi:membrane protein YdbS with pleckstrin-like domain